MDRILDARVGRIKIIVPQEIVTAHDAWRRTIQTVIVARTAWAAYAKEHHVDAQAFARVRPHRDDWTPASQRRADERWLTKQYGKEAVVLWGAARDADAAEQRASNAFGDFFYVDKQGSPDPLFGVVSSLLFAAARPSVETDTPTP